MVRYNLKIALRSILKNRSYTLINIFGLAAGMMSCIFIVLWIFDEISYDRFHVDADRIYRIDWYSENPQTRTPYPMSYTLVNDMPEVQQAVSLTPIWGDGLTRPMRTVKKGEIQFEEEGFFAADTSFFDVFSFNMIMGNPENALKDVGGLVVTKKIANKYFKDENPIGKQLIINFGIDIPFSITGVIEDIPQNSHIKFDFLVSYVSLKTSFSPEFFEWQDFGHYNYLKLSKGADSRQVEQKINEWTKNYLDWSESDLEAFVNGSIRFKLQPITQIHLHSNIRWELEPNGDITYVKIFGTLAIFIILIACINFMNLATAKVTNRAVEIGLKKAVGASRFQLIIQFYGEALISSFIAITVALILFEILANTIGSITEKVFFLNYGSPIVVGSLIVLTLFCATIAGTYPAIVLSKFNPANIIKGLPVGGRQKFNFRKALVVFQFAISTFLILGALVIASQLKYMRNKKLGFNTDHVLVIPIKDASMRNNYESTKTEFLRNSNILNVSAVSNIPGKSFNQNPIRWVEDESTDGDVSEYSVDHDFFKTLDLKIINGRSFSKDRKADIEYSFIINQETASLFDWENPVNEELIWFDDDTTRQGMVIGVVEDFHFQSLHKSIEPLIINVFPSTFNYFLVKINGDFIPSSIEHLQKVFTSIDHANNFTFFFLNEDINKLYKSEENIESIFVYFTILAIIISCIGLFGLSSYDAERRTKEIGIRKVNGASEWIVVALLSKNFLKWVLIAFIIACPCGWFVMNGWLSNFAYQTTLSWYNFMWTGILVISVGLFTVSIHAIKAARKNPVDVLKYE